MTQEYNSWADIEKFCPINVGRIIRYYKNFDSYTPSKITMENLEETKELLFNARASLDSMITSLIQILYDINILIQAEDKILYAWLIDNLGRFMKRLDEREEFFLIKFDEPSQEKSRVGISRLSAYWKTLKTSADSLIYESLLKSTEEYHNFKETDKIKKEPRAFLYILFQVLHVTLSILGGLTREQTGISRKGIVQTIPTSWQSLMGFHGQKLIREGYKEDTGIDLSPFEEDLVKFEMEEE